MLLTVVEVLLFSLDVLLEQMSVAVVFSVHFLLHYGISHAIMDNDTYLSYPLTY
jgi:hypothetical protein